MNNCTVKDKDNSVTKIYLPGHLLKEIQQDKANIKGKYCGKYGLNAKYVDNEKEKERLENNLLSYYI